MSVYSLHCPGYLCFFLLRRLRIVFMISSCSYIDHIFDLAQISSRNLDRVRKLKSSMTRLNARVQKVLHFQILVTT